MSHTNHQNQESRYGQLVNRLLDIAAISGKQPVDTVTEIVHELGTTDMAIGDVTAEVMITTLGKIPNEMYYLEDTTTNAKLTHKFSATSEYQKAIAATTEAVKTSNESTGHSSVLVILLIILLIILLLCCTSACLIAKSKRKSSFFGKSDMQCEPGCTGMNQPLLDKVSDCTNKTSVSSLRN